MRNSSDMLKLERIYRKYASKMMNSALEILKDRALAEDAVHNAFLKLPKNLYKLDEANEKSTTAYLIVSAKNAARSIYKKQYGHGYCEDMDEQIQIPSSFNVENAVIAKETVGEVANILSEMNSVYKEAVILYYMFDHTIHEIAVMTDSKEDTVRKRIKRVQRYIKDRIERSE